MDRDAFDGLTKVLASSPSRRAALGALLGAGLAGSLGAAASARKDRKPRRGGKQGKARVTAQAADCLSPGHGANISGCPFQAADFSGDDLASSRMVGTNFRNAWLVGTDLSSSNARDAVFREADLKCADLRSSTLGGADFRGADLTGASLKSSGGCTSATFNANTTFCGTVMCDGSVRNDDCEGGLPAGTCCFADADCPDGRPCEGGLCGCLSGQERLVNGTCFRPCTEVDCTGDCECQGSVSGHSICTVADPGNSCRSDSNCREGTACFLTGGAFGFTCQVVC